MTQTEALRLALEALEKISMGGDPRWADQAITAIEAVLEAKDEPVAIVAEIYMSRYTIEWTNGDLPEGTKLYATPPQRTWVGLTPACPQGLTEYACKVEGVDLVCFLEYTPDEEGSRDSRGLLDEPGTFENLELVNSYVKGTDVDIGHLLLQYLVDHITTTALEDFKNDDL